MSISKPPRREYIPDFARPFLPSLSMTLSFFFSFKENCVRAFLILTASANRSKLAYSFGPPPCSRLAAAAEEEEDVYTKMYPNYSYRGKKEKRREKKKEKGKDNGIDYSS